MQILLVILIPGVYALIIHVPGDQPSIQAGIDVAVDGDTVLLADGTYTGEGNREIEFNDKAITLTSENGRESCVIDGEGAYRLLYLYYSHETNEAVISEISFRNGSAIAIWLQYSSPSFISCIISDCASTALYCRENEPYFENCIFENNSEYAFYQFPAITCTSSCAVFDNCLFTGNSGGFNEAGAMRFRGECDENETGAVVRNCTFIGNTTNYQGGAIYGSGTLTIENCDFIDNYASYRGGAMAYGGYPTRNCYFSGNQAGDYGGAVYKGARYERCVFDGNRAYKGGAVYMAEGGSPVYDSCIFRNNIAEYGGAFFIDQSSPVIRNCVIHDNGQPYTLGGGVRVLLGDNLLGDRKLVFHNNIVYRNRGQDAGFSNQFAGPYDWQLSNSIFRENQSGQLACPAGSEIILMHCNVEGDYPGYNNFETNPGFVSPYDFHLTDDSPCIDAGYRLDCPETDYDGNERPGGFDVDVGIYEYDGWPPDSRIHIRMRDHLIYPGDPCSCEIVIFNAGPEAIEDQPLFMILDIYGEYFFAPGFTEFDYYDQTFPTHTSVVQVLEEFPWPAGAGIGTATWYAALTDPDITRLTTPLAVWDFSWWEERP